MDGELFFCTIGGEVLKIGIVVIVIILYTVILNTLIIIIVFVMITTSVIIPIRRILRMVKIYRYLVKEREGFSGSREIQP